MKRIIMACVFPVASFLLNAGEVSPRKKRDVCAAGDHMNGGGVMQYTNGERNEGEFKGGAKHGRGILTFPGVVYKGGLRDGEYSGEGTWIYPDKTKYRGEVLNSLRHGRGTLYGAKGKALKKGRRSNDEFKGE